MSEIKPQRANIKGNARPERAGPKPPKRITPDYLHNSGLHYLQRFAAGSNHFRRVMMRKVDKSCRFHADQDRAACAAMVEALIEKFRRAGLLDDEAYVRGSVSSLRRRGLSGRAIGAKLAAKGVSEQDVRQALAENDAEHGEANGDLTAAVRFARKRRIGPFARPDTESQDDKAMAAFARAGFDYQTARKALSMPMDEAEALITA